MQPVTIKCDVSCRYLTDHAFQVEEGIYFFTHGAILLACEEIISSLILLSF